MQQLEEAEEDLDVKNIIVLGKTGQGKSYFLNLLLQEEKAKHGTFKTFTQSECGTEECCLVEKQTVSYGLDPQHSITMNLIDTPGLFDTKKDIKNKEKEIKITNQQTSQQNGLPRSISHLINISKEITGPAIQQQISRVLLVISGDIRFDEHQIEMLEICKIIIGEQLRVSVIITKCQNWYSLRQDTEEEITAILEKCTNDWRRQLNQYGMEDIFFIGDSTIKQQDQQYEFLNKFYQQQWWNLYSDLKKSLKKQMRIWDHLSFQDKNIIAKFFKFTFPEVIQCINLSVQDQPENKGGCISLDVSVDEINNQVLNFNRDVYRMQNYKISIKGKDEQSNSTLGMIHYSFYEKCAFLKFIFEHKQVKGFVELTSDHLIYCSNRQKFIKADQVVLNDTLLCHRNKIQEIVQIIEISLVIKSGYYSPLTSTGQFFGNGILLSSYTSPVEYPVSQDRAHQAMKPLILYRSIMMRPIKVATEQQAFITSEKYQAKYSQMLQWIFCQPKK